LSLALTDLELQLPYRCKQYKFVKDGDPEDLWSLEGKRGIFRSNTNKHYKLLHQSVKGDPTGNLYPEVGYPMDELPPEMLPQ
jgi:hypothetical protein